MTESSPTDHRLTYRMRDIGLKMMSRWGFAGVLGFAGALLTLLFVETASGEAERGATQYYGRNQCGIVDVTKLPPRTYLTVDIDGDGQPEHFIANWGGVEQMRLQPGSTPPVYVLDHVVYRSTTTTQYACADLRAFDVDDDGDADLVFATPAELVVLENRGGRLVVGRRVPQHAPPEADVRIRQQGGQLRVVFQ